MEVLFASNNHHKKTELSEILKPHTVLIPSDIGVAFDFNESGSTYLENALGKAFALFRQIKGTPKEMPVVSDDSGLSIPALKGDPGVYSSRYGSKEAGRRLSDAERNRYLLHKLAGVTDRRGFFVCSMVLVFHEYRFFAAQETLDGEIAYQPAGSGGFGYDPLLFLNEYGKTVAELLPAEKNRISHRGKAGIRIRDILDREERLKQRR
ncbi:MAG: non-canonical purine NTP pyrophosphatase [Spirochaetota bacterium]